MPHLKPEPFWRSQELIELLRRQQAMFRRTTKPKPPQDEDESHQHRPKDGERLAVSRKVISSSRSPNES